MNKAVLPVGLTPCRSPPRPPANTPAALEGQAHPARHRQPGLRAPRSRSQAAGRGGTRASPQARPWHCTNAERAALRGHPSPGLVRAEPGNVHFAGTRGSSQDCVAGLPGPSFPAASTPLALGCPAPAPGSPELTRTPHLCLPCPRSSSFPREPQLLLFIHPQNSVGASLGREGRCGRDRSHFSQVIAVPTHTHIHTFPDPWGDVSPPVPEDRCPGAPLAALAV